MISKNIKPTYIVSDHLLKTKISWNTCTTYIQISFKVPLVVSLSPILCLIRSTTSAVVADASNSNEWNCPSMKWKRAYIGLRFIVHKISCFEGAHCRRRLFRALTRHWRREECKENTVNSFLSKPSV